MSKHKIFLCFFGEYLMHRRSGLCNVNFRVCRKKVIIWKSNVALWKKLWFAKKGCSNTLALNQHSPASGCRGCLGGGNAPFSMLRTLPWRWRKPAAGVLYPWDPGHVFILGVVHPFFFRYLGPGQRCSVVGADCPPPCPGGLMEGSHGRQCKLSVVPEGVLVVGSWHRHPHSTTDGITAFSLTCKPPYFIEHVVWLERMWHIWPTPHHRA